jgi:Flp pilus assembly pilin Flp
MYSQLEPNSESGQTMAEYSVVLGILTITIVTLIGALGVAFEGRIADVVSTLGGLVP